MTSAYEQAKDEKAIILPAKTTSFKQWGEELRKRARSEAVAKEREYWRKQVLAIEKLPRDYEGSLRPVLSTRRITVKLEEESTRALLREVGEAYHTRIEEVLMVALAKALKRWSGLEEIVVDMEGHGRQEGREAIDLTRTVGWFTTIYPVRISIKGCQEVGEQIKRVKEQMRSIPEKGIGYGLLRYELGGEKEDAGGLFETGKSEVSFNYLGQLDQVLPQESAFRLASEATGPTSWAGEKQTYRLEINGLVAGDELFMHWTYNEQIHKRETVEQVARWMMDGLREIISHCRSDQAGGFTPSDFPKVALSQEELDGLISELPEMETDLI